jgi:hypothetical protein
MNAHGLISAIIVLMALIGIGTLWADTLGQKTHVLFDRNRKSLEIERQILLFKYGHQQINIMTIGNVFLMNRGSIYEIRIPSANYNYNYNLGGALGEKESTWLLQEILNWLYFK